MTPRSPAPALLLAVAVLAALCLQWATDHGPPERPSRSALAQSELQPGGYLPLLLRGRFDERTATPVAATPTATTVPTATPTPLPEGSGVVVQIARFGGVTADSQFGAATVLAAPWFTLYDDGSVLGHEYGAPEDPLPRTYAWVIARLGADEMATLVDELVDEIGFFELPAPDESGLCEPDLHTTTVYLAHGETRSLPVYGMGAYARGESPCRPREGTPEPPAAGLVSLARWTDEVLRRPLSGGAPYHPDRATLVVTRDRPVGDPPPWPFAVDLAALSSRFLEVGTSSLEPADTPAMLAAVAAESAARWSMARFAEGDERYYVGVRVEPPGWDTYVRGPSPP